MAMQFLASLAIMLLISLSSTQRRRGWDIVDWCSAFLAEWYDQVEIWSKFGHIKIEAITKCMCLKTMWLYSDYRKCILLSGVKELIPTLASVSILP